MFSGKYKCRKNKGTPTRRLVNDWLKINQKEVVFKLISLSYNFNVLVETAVQINNYIAIILNSLKTHNNHPIVITWRPYNTQNFTVFIIIFSLRRRVILIFFIFGQLPSFRWCKEKKVVLL